MHLIKGTYNFVACHVRKGPYVMVVESYEWRKSLKNETYTMCRALVPSRDLCRIFA